MKRFFTLVISFILLLLFNTSILEKDVKAASNYEQEPNDEMKLATNIELNTTYTGYSNFRTSGSWGSHIGDFDYFKFTLDKPGKVTLSMKNNEDYTWSFLLTDSNNKKFIDAKTENGVKVTDQNISHTTRSVGLPAGTYYVRVYGNYGEMEKIPYELTVEFKPSSRYEQEPNDEMKLATNIELNTTYTGYSKYLSSGSWGSHIGDFDYFKFTLDKPGKVTLSMKNNEDYTWSFLLTDSNNKKFIDAKTENGVKVTDRNISHTTRSVGLPAGTYYVRVYGNYGEMENIPYELTVGYKPSSRYEQEPNDEMKLATNIELNTTYTGYSKYLSSGSWGSHIGDFDYFKFKLDKSSEVTVSMDNHEDYTWSFLLLDSNNKKFIDAKTENGDKIRNKKSTNKSISLPAGTYYVMISGNYGEMEEIPYSLLVKKSIILTINKVTNKTSNITGKTEGNVNVEVKIGNKLLGKAKSDSKGNYKVKIKAQKKGTKLTVIATDKDKNEKTITTTVK